MTMAKKERRDKADDGGHDEEQGSQEPGTDPGGADRDANLERGADQSEGGNPENEGDQTPGPDAEDPETETGGEGEGEEQKAETGEEGLTDEKAPQAPAPVINPVLAALSKFAVEMGLKDQNQIKKWHVPRDPKTGKLFLVIDYFDNQGQYTRQRRSI